jgi:hypothetical protein
MVQYDPGGLNYSNSLGLGYNVCAISLSPRGINDENDLRALCYNGSCLDAFDAECIAAFKQLLEDIVVQLIGQPSPPPYSVNSGLPFGRTGDTCEATASGSNQSSNYVNDYDSVESAAHLHAEYDRTSWIVLPMFAMFISVADIRRTTRMDFAVSVMSCLGIKRFNQGSSVPAAAPRFADVASKVGRLRAREVAGIVAGSVMCASILGAMLNLYRLRQSETGESNGDRVANDPQ